MGKAEDKKLIKRTALLTHAFSLFMNNGIANTSISDITSHAGVAKGTFYSYFKDKDDLILKLLTQKTELLFNHSLEELKKQDDMNVDDTIVFIINDVIEQLMADTKLLRFVNKNLSSGFYKKALTNDQFKQETNFAESFYKIIQKDGDTWRDPLLMLYTVVELVSSTCHTILLEGEPVDYETFKPYLFQCIRSIINVYKN